MVIEQYLDHKHIKKLQLKLIKILCGKDSKRKRNVNETQFVELSNEDHGTTSIKHQRLIEKDILENVE